MNIKALRITTITKLILFTALLLSVAMPLINTQKASAVTASDWKPGRIIDDAVFYNKNSMSASQIQQFLDAKVPICDRNRASSNPSYQPPWTCLKEYQENTTTRENNIGRFNANGTPYQVPGGKSSAQIIWDVAQEYGINPQVLIVMLQKEQGLVTDNWPWAVQYQKAMGYACPDTAPCDTQYYGFYNQVSSAAWQLKRYIALPNNYNFKAGVTRYIQYSPNASCGGSQVYIENPATAALYNYTPYQPNQSALNNLYGSGDGCGAYGNRNFWRYFNDWFGSTYSEIAKYQTFSYAHATGSLVRDWSGGVVYKIIDGFRLPIPNYSVFLSNNYLDSSIKIMNNGDVTLPISNKLLGYRDGSLIRENGDPKIYVINCLNQYLDSCTKKHIGDYETFKYLGYYEKDVLNVAKGELNGINIGEKLLGNVQHPEGTLVSDASIGKIYLINNNRLYHITTGLLFELNRYDWSKVKIINELDRKLPIVNSFVPYDTNLLAKSTNSPMIFAIGENGYGTTYKKHISSYEAFQLLGYIQNDVKIIEQSILDSYITVPPYPYF